MPHETEWYLIVGGVFIAVGFAGTALRQLPCSTAMIYLAVGALLGPAGIGLMQLDLARDATLLRHVTEIALLVSLFAIGLRLRLPSLDRLWLLPVRLGFVAMLVTVPLVAAVATVALGLGWGPALLLAAMLSPTDPVLAHDVQVRSPGDVDLVRFALSGEGGLNDGIALPFVLAALALCGDTASTGGAAPGSAAFLGQLAWGIAGALAIGAGLGWITTHGVAWLRTRYAQALGLEGFFALGLIVIAFGVAQSAQTFGFLAVFAAGVAMRRVEHRASGPSAPREVIGTIDSTDVSATERDPAKAHAYMTESVLGFTIELERIAEAVVMTLVGGALATLSPAAFGWPMLALAAALMLLIRPLAVALSLARSPTTATQRRLIGWFGIRGIGSFYYLLFAIEHRPDAALPLVPVVLGIVALSVIVHGVSATPLMNWYHRFSRAKR
ncbi:cation:proton antiporter [Burkholderia plantarii]|uniref:Putative sodium/hydrogen exchanger n=1 Tax=Burkholderia plantarii TaxID=41899 RepID=A0A0B6RXM7_BURPL|nr:cation:proton antiporter [Burkholderia plantarii]AJK48153.1 putative sodium/hydrogen exchanger [Burkholderia plantarii]ALK32343.1 Na+/H+ antiporter-like protein [Burkholderia plantarii]WLE61467.1 cation:proton antiporter [Burkholderia plantarii]GLZ18883.1 cation transporter [Burkholderia plantarii]